ncbi:PTS mannitol transporter subunit IIA [Staphylococcus felis]|uniref:Mannitol-specific phosphotransferase enzyme IIA component n=2 Tax=Staphylococcus felis TaxID=46127 RepID=A0AAX1RZC2_9STAP|nr:PTS sugar transporter subunit IIA [Staphylococcus felis]MBH9581364.1 PTS sugar transporter subunit IIA [Staphylococcus felis]MDM8328503.1 PTS sugar transporter subunit IIA [Staphylococcus felis]MDQ7193633.1 PTS sugar transporter subunit IIA [Staphylococcus felis]REH76520.1 PTS mannitol transporter subunit IIA [Staphylococcus felis]REH80859.1 PTS mannitol transporter subunit IIA [Staphylococcus felis]
MENLLRDENVLLNTSISSKEEAIEQVGALLVKSGAVTAKYIQAMKDREQIVSTYMGNALAIPHGTDEAKNEVLTPALSLLQIPEGLEWDGEEVKIVIGIAGKDGEHLELLSKIAMTFSEEENVDKIVRANDAQTIRRLFEEADA